jgi:hypothetical protein
MNAVAQLFEALCQKLEGPGLETQRGYLVFSISSRIRPSGFSAYSRNMSEGKSEAGK